MARSLARYGWSSRLATKPVQSYLAEPAAGDGFSLARFEIEDAVAA
jgi:hypothetical protein